MKYGDDKIFWNRLAPVATPAGLGLGPIRLGSGGLSHRRQSLVGPGATRRPRGLVRPPSSGRPAQVGCGPETADRRLPLAWPRGLWLSRRGLDLPPSGSCPAGGIRRLLPPRPCVAHPQGSGLDAPTTD